MLSENQGR